MNNAAKFVKSYVEGCYVSTDGRFRAELHSTRPCEEAKAKCVRHYCIYFCGSSRMIGQALTLKEAANTYL